MGKKRQRFLFLKLGLSLGVVLGSLEVALHLFPTLVPAAYRASFPLHGVGFFEPDLLDNTPVENMPLPLYLGSFTSPPPADLVELGLAPAEVGQRDLARWGEISIVSDAMGLPNPSVPERVDVVLVGDSFAVSAGVQKPPGLVRLLEQQTGLSVYNLGVAGIGAFQERNLLFTQGLPKHPRVVVWMFFGGNDLTDALVTLYHRHQGLETWGDVHAEKRPPSLRLPAILRFLRGKRIDAARKEPVGGLRLAEVAEAESHAEYWMLPNYLQALTRTRASWQADPAFGATLEVLDEVAQSVGAAGAKLLLVYLPSKAQVLLPLLEPDADRIHAMANFGRPAAELSPGEFLIAALANGAALEDLIREACQERQIPFLSATTPLREGAKAGEIGFLEGDTHWDPRGHAQLLPDLIDAVWALLE